MLSLLRHSPLIREFARQILKEQKPPPLGRWNIEDCPIKIRNKIDLANEIAEITSKRADEILNYYFDNKINNKYEIDTKTIGV